MVRSGCTQAAQLAQRTLNHADAVPKKRGPKTYVLEALLKRVDGLEKRLQTDKKPDSPTEETALEDSNGNSVSALLPQHVSNDVSVSSFDAPALISPTDPRYASPNAFPNAFPNTQ